MELNKLNLTPREQRILESMGFDSVEKVALSTRDDLGLGKGKGGNIVQRARNILAYQGIKGITETEQQVVVTLSNATRALVVSVEDVLGVWGELLRRLDGCRLMIFRPERKPCSRCDKEAVCLCTTCGVSLCQNCRYGHEHGYYNTVDLQHLERIFNQVREKAQAYTAMPLDRRIEAEARPSEEVIKIARERGFDGFVETFLAELEGNELMKRALCCALFSTPQEPVHVLVVGDPAGGKTLARDIIVKKLGPEVELVGANTTKAGLVCNLATGEPGVLTYSDGKIVVIDEFDKIPEQDMEYCLELLSNGKCSVHSARVHETIESQFIMIAFANPMKTAFVRNPIREIGLPPILASRFAFIIKAEELEASRRRALLKRKILGQATALELSKWHLPWLREARKHYPSFSVSDAEIESYVSRVDKLIEEHLKTPLRRDLRMGDYAKRVPLAMARASFSDVDGGILEEAIQLMESCVAAWS